MSDIRKSFGGVEVLKGVRFDLARGEVHAIVGENGAGKSTLMKILSGALRPDAGRMTLAGEEVRFRDVQEARRAGVIMVYQELTLVPDLSVAENLFMGKLRSLVDYRALNRRARELLAQVGLEVAPDTLVRRLGVGEQQLVTIARAIGEQGKVLILDEPTAALSSIESERLFGLMGRLQDQGMSIAYISHRLEEIFEVASRVTVLRDGECIATLRVAETTTAEVVRLMVGRDLLTYERPRQEPGPELARFEVHAPGAQPFEFDLREGEILGMAGVIGSGRSDALHAIFGNRGHALWDGERVASPQEAIRKGAFLVPGDRKNEGLVLPLTVADNIVMASLDDLGPGGLVGWRRVARKVGEQMRALTIRPPRPQMRVGNYSGGNQQKVVVGKALATGPRILLLEEPTRGVDVGARSELYDKLSELAGQGFGIIISTSDTEELASLCDRIMVFRHRRPVVTLTAPFTTEEVTAHVTGAHRVA